MVKKRYHRQKIESASRGFTIVELLVAMSVFSLIILIVGAIFVRSIRSERIVAGRAAAFDNVALAVEQIAREVRTGVKFPQAEGVSSGGGEFKWLEFTNYYNERVVYELVEGAIKKSVNGGPLLSLTSSNVKITNLTFWIMGKGDNLPPRITIIVKAEGPFELPFNLQTTVGARLIYYKPIQP